MVGSVLFGALLLPALIMQWLPMHVGDRWVYETEIRDGNRLHPDVETWREEVTTVAIRGVRDGVLIERSVTLLDGTAPVRSAANWYPKANILVRKNCLYFLRGDQAWELPDVCIPLHTGKMWGDPNEVRGHWRVAGFDKDKGWRLEAHLASGDDNFVWFQKASGVVAEHTVHNGTYYDRRVRLIRFQAGR